jgi:hypothetical protein
MKNMIKVVLLFWTYGCFAQEEAKKGSWLKLPFVHQTTVGLLIGQSPFYSYNYYSSYIPVPYRNGAERVANFSIETFNGLRLRPKTAVGLTLGADFYENSIFMPVSAGIRQIVYEKGPKAAKIQVGLDAGINTDWLNPKQEYVDFRPGINISPKLGFVFPGRNGSAFLVNFGYRYQENSISETNPNDQFFSSVTDYKTKRFSLGLGFQF